MHKRKQRPGTTSTVSPPPPPPPTSTTKIGVFYAENNTDDQSPTTATRKQIVKDCASHQITTLSNQGMSLGATEESTTAFADYDWGSLDARIAMMNASKRTGGTLAIEFFSAPWWMLGKPRDGDYSTLASYTVLDANLGAWGDFCAYVANRYWPDVQTYVWWSEMKGYWRTDLNRWDYVRATANYNQVWQKVKAARPTAKIGGPFITTRQALEHRTGIPTIASDGSSIVSNLQVLGETWHVDARQLNTAIYWLANATGYDFVTNDGAIWPNNNPADIDPTNDRMQPATPWPAGTPNTVQHVLGATVFDDREKPRLVAEWWTAHTPAGTPHWWMESYPGSGVNPVPDFQADYGSKNAGGVDVAFLWLGKNAPRVGTRLWAAGTDTRTAVGDTAAGITAGQESSGADTTAPTRPTGLTATPVGSTQINLVWNASTDAVGVTGYRVRRGGVLVATVTGTSYADTGRTASTTYSYTVAAIDAAGNQSTVSVIVSATTPAASSTVIYGVNAGNDANDAYPKRITEFGRVPITRVYYPQAQNGLGASGVFNTAREGGAESVAQVSFKTLPANILNGSWDGKLTTYVQSIPANFQVMMTYWHEPNSELNVGTFTAADYKSAWYRISDLMVSLGVVASGRVICAPNYTSPYPQIGVAWSRTWIPDVTLMHPGTRLTWDSYGNLYGGAGLDSPYRPVAEVIDPAVAEHVATGYTNWGITEFNTPQRNHDPTAVARTQWIQDYVDYLLALNPRPKSVILWEGDGVQFDQRFITQNIRDKWRDITALSP